MSDVLPFERPITAEELGERLVHARKRAGLTGRAAATLTGLSPMVLSRWEHGRNLGQVVDLLRAFESYGYVLKLCPTFESKTPSRAWDGAGRITPRDTEPLR